MDRLREESTGAGMMKMRIKADKMAGLISGSVTFLTVLSNNEPDVLAASSSAGSIFCIVVAIIRKANGTWEMPATHIMPDKV